MYDTKNYEFITTDSVAPGAVTPPPGEKWQFVQMTPGTAGRVTVLWARVKGGK